jgi:hypothetical protein
MSKKTVDKKTTGEILQIPHVTLQNVEDDMIAGGPRRDDE